MQHHHTPPHFIRSPIAQAVVAALLAMPVAAWAGSGSCTNGVTTLMPD